ncbi:type I restriction endonuclease subunit S [Pedobacter sp. KBS0701]|uniref:restriction endonuclease subunit S n=1 Tax=Pedobacter sp. KBS0701 TaxID=2578106 RepID=UPI00110D55B2|nr:restriction endonuclease subunit S [Pedobacter sp. KBS0701]QDW25654.1 type I restriction endonuclease subunit S [Pedobacter sp. KBS0701]
MREDWIECEIGDVFDVVTGNTPSKANPLLYGGNIPFIKPPEINNKEVEDASEFLTEEGAKVARILPKYSVLITCIGNLGRVAMNSKFEVAFNQQINALKPNKFVYPKYIYYKAQSSNFRNQLEELSTGVTVSLVNKTNFSKVRFPLPPLPEQRAIVKKLESLFSSLDAGVADLKKAQQQLKIYRQAVLKKAFDSVNNFKTIIEIASVNTGSTPKRGTNKYWDGGTIPWVTSGSLNELFVDKADEYITEVALKETNCKVIPIGSLLIAMYGEGKTRGKCSELKIGAATNQAIACVTIKDEFLYSKSFVKWFFIKNYQDIRLLSNGGVQPNLNLSIIKNTVIPFPGKEEQKEIVKQIESRLSVCDSIEQNIKESLEKAEVLRQSILKKAFEGNLLTAQELAECKLATDYEPASVLLERIKAEQNKATAKPGKKKVTQPLVVAKVETPVLKISADIHAGLIAKVIKIHEENPASIDNLSHIKCEKIAHLVEYHLQIPLGRQPVKDAAGPDDYPHLKKIEHRAKMANYFAIQKKDIGYSYSSAKNSDKAIEKFQSALSDEENKQLDGLIALFLNFDLEVSEIIATTYAGWNNLILIGNANPSDEEIVYESRENWSERKLKIARERFFKAIEWMRKNEIVPTGYGAVVPFPKKKK